MKNQKNGENRGISKFFNDRGVGLTPLHISGVCLWALLVQPTLTGCSC